MVKMASTNIKYTAEQECCFVFFFCRRYYAIVHPLSAMAVHSKSRTRKLIAVTWVVPLILASPYLYCRSYTFTIHSRYGVASRQICADRFDDVGDHFRRGFFLLLFVVVYVVPMFLIGVTCVRIAVTLHRPTTTSTDTSAAAPVTRQREENKRRVSNSCQPCVMYSLFRERRSI